MSYLNDYINSGMNAESNFTKWLIYCCSESFNENISNDNGDLLTDFSAHNNLTIYNTFFDKWKYQYTLINTHRQQSTIDYN